MMCDALIHAGAIIVAACIIADSRQPVARGGCQPRRGPMAPPPRAAGDGSPPARPTR